MKFRSNCCKTRPLQVNERDTYRLCVASPWSKSRELIFRVLYEEGGFNREGRGVDRQNTILEERCYFDLFLSVL